MINLKNFKSGLLKIDEKSFKNIGVYNIWYITIKKINDYEYSNSVNPLHLMMGDIIGYIKENDKKNI